MPCSAPSRTLVHLLAVATCATAPVGSPASGVVDRAALVARHAIVLHAVDPSSPLTVGNGHFAFTADVSGLQTFTAFYHDHGCPAETQARWLWESYPNPHNYTLADASRDFTMPDGRVQPFPTRQSTPAGAWLRSNPHTVPLPMLALDLVADDGSTIPLTTTSLGDIDQRLDLWRGVLTSRYTLDGAPVEVVTVADPDADRVAVRVTSPLLAHARLGVRLAFPLGYDPATKNNPGLDWTPSGHTTERVRTGDHELALAETLTASGSRYYATVDWDAGTDVVSVGAHAMRIQAGGEPAIPESPSSTQTADATPQAPSLAFSVTFAQDAPPPANARAAFAATLAASEAHWPAFWRSGGALDLSGSTDPRAPELERRVVLSQYLLAVNFDGAFPPQETGLTCSSWYGKHHTEMIWWHTAHFALWGRDAYLEHALDWYVSALPAAREIAASRGLRGARWPKMIGPDAHESPGGNPLIVWNQPHPIALAELLYRNHPTPETLARWAELVDATADGLAAMLHWNEKRGCYELGPPLWISQEIYDQATSRDPSFELSYWATALEIAQRWRERAGLPRNPDWEQRRTHLAPLPVKDGRYVALESTPDTWDNVDSRHDHPTMIGMYGLLPGAAADPRIVRRTFDAVMTHWDWETKIWGWDYPMLAMTAARLGDPRAAVDVLLRDDAPNNHYVASGHCPQRGDLPVYLPANGALLSAVAMMVAGWDGAPAGMTAPGFPQDGTWVVRAEGLHPLP